MNSIAPIRNTKWEHDNGSVLSIFRPSFPCNSIIGREELWGLGNTGQRVKFPLLPAADCPPKQSNNQMAEEKTLVDHKVELVGRERG